MMTPETTIAVENIFKSLNSYDYSIENRIALANDAIKKAKESQQQLVAAKLTYKLGELYQEAEKLKKMTATYREAAQLYQELGQTFRQNEEYDTALAYYEESIRIAKNINSDYLLLRSYSRMGRIYQDEKDNFVKAAACYQEGLKLCEGQANLEEAVFQLNMGIIYHQQVEHTEAIKMILAALQIFEQIGHENGLASCYNTMGNIHNQRGEYEKALRHYSFALEIARNQNAESDIVNILNNIGTIYLAKEEPNAALERFEELITLTKNKKDVIYYNLGKCYYILRDFKNSEDNHKEAIKYNKQKNDKKQLANIYIELAKIYLEQKKYKAAETHLMDALALTREENYQEGQLECLLVLKKVFFNIGKYDMAFEYYDSYTKLNKKIFDVKKEENIQRMTILYEIKEKEREIAYGKKLMHELQHRVKNNLTVLDSMLKLQIPTVSNEKTKVVLQDIRQRIIAMHAVHEQLYRGENATEVALEPFITNLVRAITTANQKNNETKVNTRIYVDYGNLNAKKVIEVALILNELICNAFKYAFKNHPEPVLTVSLKRNLQTRRLHLIVKDNGKGIDLEKLKESNGFGIKLNNLLTEELRGELNVDAKEGTKWELIFKA